MGQGFETFPQQVRRKPCPRPPPRESALLCLVFEGFSIVTGQVSTSHHNEAWEVGAHCPLLGRALENVTRSTGQLCPGPTASLTHLAAQWPSGTQAPFSSTYSDLLSLLTGAPWHRPQAPGRGLGTGLLSPTSKCGPSMSLGAAVTQRTLSQLSGPWPPCTKGRQLLAWLSVIRDVS